MLRPRGGAGRKAFGLKVLLVSVQRNLNILGLRYLHEHLLAHGHDSRLLFLNRYDDENAAALERLRAFIAEFNPGMVGVSLTAYDYPHARPFSVRCKQWFPEIPLVWGGIHPTTEPEDSLNYADLIVRGEGEGALLDLVTAMEAGTSPDNIDNLGFRRGGETRLNPVRPLIQDLDALPMLTQVPAAAWIHPGVEVEPLTLRHVRKYKMFRGAIYRIMVSRGCPMHCAYCANSFLKGLYPDMKLRWRSTENIMRELELAITEDPAIRAVTFADDVLLSMPVDDLRDFCAQYKARVGLPLMAKTTPAHITRERMDLLVGAGMGWVNVGLQDANDRICKEVYKRPIGWEVFRRAADLIHEYPVAPYYDLILNNPFATFEEDVKTAEMLLDLPRPYFLQPFSLTFYRGTEIRERALRERPECVVEPEFKDCYHVEFVPKEAVKVICTTIHRPVGRALIRRLRRVPDGWLTQFLMDLAGFYHRMVLQPLTMLRLLRRSQKDSVLGALKMLPVVVDFRFVTTFNLLHNTKDSTEE